MKKIRHAFSGLAAILLLCSKAAMMTAWAVNYNYVTITVDAVDDFGSLQYAIDSDAPEAFSDKSSFQVVPGSTHTIYVKDLSGNVTSQIYSIPPAQEENQVPEQKPELPGQTGTGTIRADTNVSESYDPDTDERKINIDVNLANGSYASSGAGSAAEDGGGTLSDKEETDGTDDSGKIFYTVTTKEGEVFYLVVDQNRGENNVYLLTQATVNDLQHLADQNDYNFTISATGQNSQILLNMLSGNGNTGAGQVQPGNGTSPDAETGTNSTIILLAAAAAGGGAYYFYKTRKNRREKQMDEIDAANDLQDYEIEGEDEDVLEFDEEPEEQEQAMKDEDLEELMRLNTEAVFGEEGEEDEPVDLKDLDPAEMGLDDYDEFGEEEE